MKSKKVKKVIVFFSFLLMIIPLSIKAKTLNDYRNELQALRNEKQQAESMQEQTKEEIEKTKREIDEASVSIVTAKEEVDKTKEEIKSLEKEIAKKEEEIKDLVVFLQVSNSESFYLNYIFGAKGFTDFIYRVSVTNQLTSKNDKLVDEMNNLIKTNEEKIKELEKKQKELAELSASLQKKIASLGSNLTSYSETAADIDTQIGSMERLISYYESKNCAENEDVSRCDTGVPFDSSWNRPLKSGVVTDEFGMRYHPTLYVWRLHSGIDLGGNYEGTPVYAPASGKVVALYWQESCGGNQVIMNHIVDGGYYTTQYMHLLNINVSVGQVVEKGQQIATVGGGNSTSWYDGCSTGEHLHFMVAKGHYLGSGPHSYSSYATYYENLFDARDIVWFPAYGVWF